MDHLREYCSIPQLAAIAVRAMPDEVVTTNVSLEMVVIAAGGGGCFLSTSFMFTTVGGSRMHRFHRILLSIFTDGSQAREKTKLDRQQQQKEMEEIMETAFHGKLAARLEYIQSNLNNQYHTMANFQFANSHLSFAFLAMMQGPQLQTARFLHFDII